MVNYNNLLFQKEGNIGIVTINRPQVRNALNTEVCIELYKVVEEIEQDPEVRVVIITGSGDKAFVAGSDIKEMASFNAIDIGKFAQTVRNVADKIYSLNKPVIAAINGFALGGGSELALACDIRIASENAHFGQTEINVGIIPGTGGTQRLPRLVGIARAKELVFTGDIIDAQTALNIGLVNKIVPQDKLMEEAKAFANKLLSKSSRILALAKTAINTGMNLDLASGLDYEAQCLALCFETYDQKEGMKAFIEKRKAEYKNR